MTDPISRRLVLFDFDGTLTRRDSLLVFLYYYKGMLYFLINMFISLPVLIGYKLGIVNNSRAKEKLLSNFLKGKDFKEFTLRCKQFSKEKIPLILNKETMDKFRDHLSRHDKVLIVSASLEDWIKPWAEQWEVEILATRLASERGILTGKFDGENCNGQEKVRRITAHLSLSNYDEILAYGNSSGDEAMFSLATKIEVVSH